MMPYNIIATGVGFAFYGLVLPLPSSRKLVLWTCITVVLDVIFRSIVLYFDWWSRRMVFPLVVLATFSPALGFLMYEAWKLTNEPDLVSFWRAEAFYFRKQLSPSFAHLEASNSVLPVFDGSASLDNLRSDSLSSSTSDNGDELVSAVSLLSMPFRAWTRRLSQQRSTELERPDAPRSNEPSSPHDSVMAMPDFDDDSFCSPIAPSPGIFNEPIFTSSRPARPPPSPPQPQLHTTGMTMTSLASRGSNPARGLEFNSSETSDVETRSCASMGFSTISSLDEEHKDVTQTHTSSDCEGSNGPHAHPASRQRLSRVRHSIFHTGMWLIAVLAVILVSFVFCQLYAAKFLQMSSLRKLGQVEQTLAVVVFTLPLLVLKIVMKRVTSQFDAYHEVDIRPLCLFTMDLFRLVFQRNLFLEIDSYTVIVVINIAAFGLDMLIYVFGTTAVFFVVYTRTCVALRRRLGMFATLVPEPVSYRVFVQQSAIDYFFEVIVDTMTIVGFCILAVVLHNSHNRGVFPYTEADGVSHTSSLPRFAAYVAITLACSRLSVYIVRAWHSAALRATSHKLGSMVLTSPEFLIAAITISTHILQDYVLAVLTVEFE
ncbi:uncharacterized protein AMSG_04689 [Thecamonas trahens ATCC 50062]|uniref:Transmembrane protein n=1 Tax=Thecamonas trahens ATCC 50062 TaxID=461836 RepID=A0A0L0D9C4_THETB|nr:hypothetical protein AMSG_04689 [Thecamonas trahens ATCC 50062]KNC48944.1 hypothetical protein AMSG_04689 [Thecamonas trahens ATCC 50062]|eukprot:XP_013758361.1 hypothetical protein AMSG_04689 [Thecamonas trahens ATCC 50062]